MAHYDTKTGEIVYTDPFDNIIRQGMLEYQQKYPELKMRCVNEADFSDEERYKKFLYTEWWENDELWFDRGAGTAYTVRMDFQMIPGNALNYGISAEMTEMAKIAMINYAASDIFEQIGSGERAKYSEEKGNKFVAALQNRYEMLREKESGFISPEAAWDEASKHYPDDEWVRLGW